MKYFTRIATTLILLCGSLALSLTANADPITDGTTISTTIYGDARDGNPGDLALDVSITFTYDAMTELWTSHWSVAINQGTIDDYSTGLKIQAFGFNLDAANVAISNLSPSIMDANINGGQVVGTGSGGNTSVEFLICNDGPSAGFTCSGNTVGAFTFDLTVGGGAQFDTDMFDNATIFSGDYIYGDGLGQMAAHIIGFAGGCSGAVGGMYGENTAGDGVGDGVGECGTTSVPEPATLSLLGIGLLGIALSRRRRLAVAKN